MPRLPVLALLPLLLAGCALHTPWQAPASDLPARWQQQASGQTLESGWWRAFGDAQLDGLVEQAFASNDSLASALASLRQARRQAGIAGNELWPQASGDGSASSTKALDGSDGSARSYGLGASLSWEIDLWNRLGHLRDAAELEARASAEDYAAARLELAASVSSLYWQLAWANQHIALSQQGIDYAVETLQLVQVQFDAGSTTELELAEARQNLESLRASHASLQQTQVEARNALAQLFGGQLPDGFSEPQQLTAVPPEVAADLPASVLAQRPDLRAAELRLRSTLAGVDATRASWYPSLSLTGSLGYSSSALGELLQNPVGTLGAGLALPFLNWNRMQLEVAAAREGYAAAVHHFRSRLHGALIEVENALAARRNHAEREKRLMLARDAAAEAERIYRVRYEAGAIDLQSWLAARESLRSTEVALGEARLDRLLDHIRLAQALGGGHDLAGAENR